MKMCFPGEEICTTEADVHLPLLKVGDTLVFAANRSVATRTSSVLG